MNRLEKKLKKRNSGLFESFQFTLKEVELLLSKYSENFPTYTDHSLNHTYNVLKIASELLTDSEIENLNGEELYTLCMACILHDVGMCIPEQKLLTEFDRYGVYEMENQFANKEKKIRDIHHELSYDFICSEWKLLKIPDEKYAEAIARVSMGHRKVQLDDTSLYPTKYFVKNGRDFVCLPYIACVLRLADELDITNLRTPDLLTKYYMPNNEVSVREWKKHISTTQINYTEDKILFEVKCSDQNSLAALESQFEKIQDVSNYCQKIVRNISNVENRSFELMANKIEPHFSYINFDPKGIQFTFNVKNVVNTFIGKDLYKNELTALREVVQNSIDSCRYKISLGTENYNPEITIDLQNEEIKVSDNGLGMDEFIIENFFGKLGSSFYSDDEVKEDYEAIGQFGVGVFSYFLLGDYIDIETKTEKNSSLKFRIDKDPKNYFHFFEESNKKDVGTTITLPLKEDIRDKFSFSDYVFYIKNSFNSIEFPIFIEGGATKMKIGQQPFKSPEMDYVKENIKFQFLDKINELQCLTVSLDNEWVSGEVSLILNKFDSEIKLKSISEYFNYESFSGTVNYNEYSKIRISQKGVFVNYYSSDLLNFTIGNLNIENSIPIKISRNEFNDEQEVETIINEFEIAIISKLFNLMNSGSDNECACINTYNFIKDYLKYFSVYSLAEEHKKQLKESFEKYFHFKFYSRKSVTFLSLKELLSKKKDFIVVSELEDYKHLHNHFSKDILITPELDSDNYWFFYFIDSLFEGIYDLKSSMVNEDNNYYLIYHADNQDKSLKEELRDLFEFSDWSFRDIKPIQGEIIATSHLLNKKCYKKEDIRDIGLAYNLNHPYVTFLLDNFKDWLKDTEKVKIIKATAEIISQIVFDKLEIKKGLQILNDSVSALDNIQLTFTKKDFAKE